MTTVSRLPLKETRELEQGKSKTLQCLQQPATGPLSESHESISHQHILFY
jgi:hypothetical protein